MHCMLANNLYFGKFMLFCNLHSFISAKLCFLSLSLSPIVFLAEHSFCVSQIVNPLSRGTPIFVVFGDLYGYKKVPFSPKQIVATKMRVSFYLPRTHSVCLFLKMPFLQKSLCEPPQKHYSSGLALKLSSFAVFSYFLVFFSNIKNRRTESAHFLRKPF